MKTFNSNNFFTNTFCDFKKVKKEFFNENEIHFKSKAGSNYSYTKEGVFRFSNHWGKVANCRWKLLSDEKLKNQEYYLGFAKWTDFYALNETVKQFYISVDFNSNEVNFHHKKETENVFLYFADEAQKRVRQIKYLLKDDRWASYFESEIQALRVKVITEFMNSNETLSTIKIKFK